MIKYKRSASIIKILVFVVCFTGIFSYLTELTIRKSLTGAWDMTNKIGGFYNEEEDSIDVLFLGSSHAYASFVPTILEEETGITSYVFSSQLQPITANYYYFKEALKTQKPKLVVIEVFSAVFDYELDEGIVHSYTDDIPLSFNKAMMIYNTVPQGMQKECFIPIIKYHVRWNELDENDWQFKRDELHDSLRGHVALEQCNNELVLKTGDLEKLESITAKNEEYILKIIELAKENNIKLLFVKTPTTEYVDYQGKVNYVKDLVAKHGIEFIDYNVGYDGEYKADIKTDFFDKRHLNSVGANRFMKDFNRHIVRILENE